MENVVVNILFFGIPLMMIIYSIATYVVFIVMREISKAVLKFLGSKTYWEYEYKKKTEKRVKEIEEEKEKEYNDKLRAALTEFYEKEHEKKEDEDIVQKV